MAVKLPISLSDQQDGFARGPVEQGRYSGVSAVGLGRSQPADRACQNLRYVGGERWNLAHLVLSGGLTYTPYICVYPKRL